jgi:hypothetical protein
MAETTRVRVVFTVCDGGSEADADDPRFLLTGDVVDDEIAFDIFIKLNIDCRDIFLFRLQYQ